MSVHKTMKAVRVHKPGGADVLSYEDTELPTVKPGFVLIKNHAIGVNFIDIYVREGRYPKPTPFTAGTEGAGEVAEISADEKDLKVGDSVAYFSGEAYAEYTVAPISKVVKVPKGVDYESAAAILLQGLTAQYLVRSTFAVKKGDKVLVHAAAGGMGLLLTSVCKHLGAFVIGTCSTEEKAKLAKEAGADHVIVYSKQDFLEEVKKITENKGVDVVYDGVGKDTFLKGLDCLRPRGMMALYGAASGPVAPFDPLLLSGKGSLFLARPSLQHHTITKEETEERAKEVFEWLNHGVIKVNIGKKFALKDVGSAHKALEGRLTTGKVILNP